MSDEFSANSKNPDFRQHKSILRAIGLTEAEVMLYMFMTHQSFTSWRVGYIKEKLSLPSSSLYRALAGLERKGFVQAYRMIGPTWWRPIPLTHALDEYADYHRNLAKPIINWQRDHEDA